MRFIKTLSATAIFTIAAVCPSLAEPSKPIRTALSTPVTTFDDFLFRMHEQSKCRNGWFGNSKSDDLETPCMTTLDYRFDDNLIEMNFFVDDSHEDLRGFSKLTDDKKKEVLMSVLSDVALRVGVAEYEGIPIKIGLIQMTPMRYGWGSDEFNETEIRDEIASRTVVVLRANIRDGYIYKATRSHHGKLFYEQEERE